MKEFVDFLLTKVYSPKNIPQEFITEAFEQTVLDVNYHFPELSVSEIEKRLVTNSNELAVFLFRLGNVLHQKNQDILKSQIHWLLKELCACEIYFNNQIGVGFYLIHGEGTVIGSRNVIGKGFKIHQGCTIGHKRNGVGKGNTIGNDVTMYCNSSIIGELRIGDNVVVGAHILVTRDVETNHILTDSTTPKVKSLQ